MQVALSPAAAHAAPPPRRGRVCVTYCSPSMDRPDTEQVLHGPTLRQALHTILRRLGATPAEIVAERLSGGAIGLSRRREDGYLWLVGVVSEGPTLEQVAGGLSVLDTEGWRP